MDVAGRFAATHRYEPTLDRASKQQFHQALIAPRLLALQLVFTPVDSFDFEFLSGLDAIPLPEFGGENDLAFGGDGGFHAGKILSYAAIVNRVRIEPFDRAQDTSYQSPGDW